MLDITAWADDAPLYYARLRSAAIPNGVAQYGDEPKGGGGKAASKPPISLGAFEAAERESVALWRVLSHLGANRPFDPFMRAQGRRVIGLKMLDDPEFVVACMAEDVIAYLDLVGVGAVPSRTLSFCHKARSQSKLVVGDLSSVSGTWDSLPLWVKSSVAVEYGVSYPLLNAWRSRGKVAFVRQGDDILYCRDSLRVAVDDLLTRRARLEE